MLERRVSLPSSPVGGATRVKHIPYAYEATNSEASARKLIFVLRPEWQDSEGEVEFVKFKEGITNNLFKAIKKRPGLTEREVDADAVMLRAYGNGTAILIDREREAQSHSLLAKHDLAPALLARFDNGLLYEYIEGIACSPEDMRSSKVWPSTARLLGQWHATLPVAGTNDASILENPAYATITSLLPGVPTPNIWTVMQRWILALPTTTPAELARQQTLQKELEFSTKLLGNTKGLNNGEYTLSHCDLLSGNIIILPGDSKAVSFIDYEYTTPSPAAFDLANHFAEWGGFACDYTVLPTRSQRRAFIHEYVASYRSHKSATTTSPLTSQSTSTPQQQPPTIPPSSSTNETSLEDDTTQLIAEVDSCRGLPGLYWGIWALIQATISQIDFDYASYAEVRLAEYGDWKAEAGAEGGVEVDRDDGVDGRKEGNGAMGNGNGDARRERSVRERRLAED